MNTQLIAKATVSINVSLATVWDALTNPEVIKQYMFGTDVDSDWKEGSTIVWKGVWEEKPYEDKGIILKIEPQKLLQYSHFSPLSGAPDVPENYHTLTYELTEKGQNTFVSLTQDNNANEEAREHSQKMWETMLESMKKILEK